MLWDGQQARTVLPSDKEERWCLRRMAGRSWTRRGRGAVTSTAPQLSVEKASPTAEGSGTAGTQVVSGRDQDGKSSVLSTAKTRW